MANADSGPRSSSHFYHYRWIYIGSTLLLWYATITLIFFKIGDGYLDAFYPDTIFRVLVFGRDTDLIHARMYGVFAFNFEQNYFEQHLGFDVDLLHSQDLAAGIASLLLVTCVILFVIPERGRSSTLPAKQGLPFRARFAAAIIFGLAATAMVAGAVDVLGFNGDVTREFKNLNWFSDTMTGSYYLWGHEKMYGYTFKPDTGIAAPISWISLLFGVFIFGIIGWVFIPRLLIRDRYWQAERWTLLLAVMGCVLILTGLTGIHLDETGGQQYVLLDLFLGGAYTAFIAGVLALTWAWTCRTCLYFMILKYEKAAIDSDEPTCFACGYDLKMLASDKCPECGASVNPKLLAKIKAKIDAEADASSEATRQAKAVIQDL